MGESETHMRLVASLVDWVAHTYCADEADSILVDSPSTRAGSRPPIIAGFVPDVYVAAPPGPLLVVGEAKTACDIDRRHTREQLAAFLNWCTWKEGSILILAVPWRYVRCAEGVLRDLKKRNTVGVTRTLVLDRLEG